MNHDLERSVITNSTFNELHQIKTFQTERTEQWIKHFHFAHLWLCMMWTWLRFMNKNFILNSPASTLKPATVFPFEFTHLKHIQTFLLLQSESRWSLRWVNWDMALCSARLARTDYAAAGPYSGYNQSVSPCYPQASAVSSLEWCR